MPQIIKQRSITNQFGGINFVQLVLAIGLLIFILAGFGQGGLISFFAAVPGWIWGIFIMIIVFNRFGRPK